MVRKLSLILCMVFLISFASAFEFDNAASYDEETRVVTIENGCIFDWAWTCTGDIIGQARLNTPLNVRVPRGYQKVAEFDIWAYDDYNDALKQFTFEDMKKGREKINREYDLKKKGYEDVEVDDYISECYYDYSNSTNGTQICNQILNGTHTEQRTTWTKITPADLKKNEVLTIGVFTEVKAGDYVDWIPMIFGVEVPEWATWTEDLNVDLRAYWKFDESSGTFALDELNGVNGTISNAQSGKTGILVKSVFFNETLSRIEFPDRLTDALIGDVTYSFWINVTTPGTLRLIYSDAESSFGKKLQIKTDGKLAVNMYGGGFLCGGNGAFNSNAVVGNAGWTHVAWGLADGECFIYINGALDNSVAEGTSTTRAGTPVYGNGHPSSSEWQSAIMNIDEAAAWNRSLDITEIETLYNGGIPPSFNESGTTPSVTLISPSNNSNLTSPNIDFITTVTDEQKVDNVTLYIDGVANETNSSGFNGTYTFSKIINEGLHNWSIQAINNQSINNQSETRIFNLTIPPIIINLLSPPDVSTHNTPLVNVSCNAEANEGVTQLNLTIDGITNITITNSTPEENLTISQILSFEEGNYTWGCSALNDMITSISNNRTFEVLYSSPILNLFNPENDTVILIENVTFIFNASDVNGMSNVTLFINGLESEFNASGVEGNYSFIKILTDGLYNWSVNAISNLGKITNSPTRFFLLHTVEPTINITSPTGDIDYFLLGDEETLVYNISEGGENASHFEECWFIYNLTNTTLNCSSNQINFTYIEGQNNITVFARDEFGFTTNKTSIWEYKILEINQTYNNETTEGSLETFLANLRLGSGLSIADAVLFSYNGSRSTGQSFISGLNTILRKADFLIPSVATDTNITFYWGVTLSDSTEINLSSQNQTIYNLEVDNCTSGTVEMFNFTVVDEETQDILPNATIEIAVNLYDETRTQLVLNYSMLFEKINPLRICLNRNISSSSIYSVDVIVRYEDTENANEYYNIVNSSFTNETQPQIITLYDLNLTDSTEFQLSFTGSDFLPVENALVYVDRQYISENTFKTVELPKTDYNGQSVLHLVRNDVIYNVRIIKDGVVLGNFENLVAFCDDFTIGDCNIELNAFDSVESVFNEDEALGIIYTSPVYSETANTISFNFLTSDGTAKTVLLGVTRNDIFGNRSICNSTLISSGGTLTCSIDPNLDESVLMVSIYVDEVLTVSGSVELESNNYGVAGYLVMFVMAMSFVFMFSGSKTGVLISLGVTFAGALGMGIISGNLIGIGASGIWLLVIIFVGIYKLNKERPA